MKNTKASCLLLLFLLLIFSCSPGPEEEKAALQASVKNILVTLFDYQSKDTLSNATITRNEGGVSTQICTQTTTVRCNFENVNPDATFMMAKNTYQDLSVKFKEFDAIDSLNLYLKKNPAGDRINLRGYTYNAQGQASSNVRVTCGSQYSTSDSNGFYTLDIPVNDGMTYLVRYAKDTILAEMTFTIAQDTLQADVFVSGFGKKATLSTPAQGN